MIKETQIKIGEGSYGCVFKPPLKCDSKISNKINVPRVGKVFFDDEDAKNENIIAEILQTFGKEAEKYLIIPIEKCNTLPEEIDKIQECNIPKLLLKSNIREKDKELFKKRKSFIQQILPYGGITLQEAISVKDTTLIDWLYALLKTFEAIQFLHSKGYAHLDIKINNIIVSDNIRLLDFGFMSSLKNIYTGASYNLQGSGEYRIYPFELRIYWIAVTGEQYPIDEIIDDFLNDYKRVRLKEITREEIKKTVVPKIFDEKLWKDASTKIDVYSVGIMCLNEHPLLTRFEKNNGFKEYIIFLQNIIHIDFTKRYSSSKAISELQKIIELIDK